MSWRALGGGLFWAGVLQLQFTAMAEVVNAPAKVVTTGPEIEPVNALESPRQGFAERVSLFPEKEPTVTWLKFGNLLLSPTYSQSAMYDDNVVGQTADKQKQDFQLNYSPRLALRYGPTRDFTFEGAYSFGWHDYASHVAPHYLTHDGQGTLNWSRVGVDGLSLRFDGSYQQTGNTGVLEKDFVAFNRLHAYDFGPTLAYRLSKLAVVLSYLYSATHYFQHRNVVNDFASTAATALLSYRLTERGLAAFATYSEKPTQTARSPGDFHTQEARAGLQGTYRRLEFSFAVGANSVSYAEPSLSAKTRPGASAGLRYVPNRVISCGLSADHAFVTGALTGTSTNTVINGVVVLDPTMADRITLTTSWQDESFETLRRDTLVYDVRYNRALTRNMKLLAQVRRTAQDTAQEQTPRQDVKITTAMIGLTFGF